MSSQPRHVNPSRRIGRITATAATAALIFGVLGATLPASAAIQNWDGGNGTWQAGVGSWDGGGTWTQNNSAVFGGTAGTVSLGAPINAAAVTLSANGYIIDLNGSDLVNAGSLTVSAPTPSSVTITNTSGTTATFTTGLLPNANPILAGNMNVIYNGAGWNPANNNTFTGSLSLLGSGTVLTQGIALGTGTIRVGGTTVFQIATSGGFTRNFANNIELLVNGATSIGPQGNMITLSGIISGTGDLRQSGTSGALILTGNNSFTGKVSYLSAGEVIIAANNNAFGLANANPTFNVIDGGGNANTLGFSGGVAVSGAKSATGFGAFRPDGLGNFHNFDGNNSFAGGITVTNGQLFNVESGSLTLTGVVGGSRSFNKGGEGTLIVANQMTVANSGGNGIFRQLINVMDGTLLEDFSAATSPAFDIFAGALVSGLPGHTTSDPLLAMRGGTIEFKGASGVANSQWFTNSRVDIGDSSMKITQNGATSVGVRLGAFSTTPNAGRNVGGTVDFTLATGTQTIWTLNQTGNGFSTSRANVNNILGGWATVGRSSWATQSGGVVVAYTHSAGEQGAAAFGTATNNVDVNATNTAATVTGATVNSLRFAAGGTLTLSGTNILSSGGILVTGTAAGTITGGTLEGAASADLIVNQNNTASPFTIASNITDNTAATALTKSGQGQLVLSGTNNYTGPTYVLGGVLKLNSAGALPGGTGATGGTSKLVLDGGGVVGLTSDFSRTIGTGTAAAATTVQWLSSGGFAAYGGTRIVNLGGTASWSNGAYDNNSSDNSITQTYTGGFVPTGSRLVFGAADADGMVDFQSNISLSGGAPIAITRTIDVANSPFVPVEARISGVVSGATDSINKIGAGTLELTGLNTYSGETIITAGTLLVNGNGTTTGLLNATSKVTVNSGATLGGTGKINGPVSLLSGGTISPGASIESLATNSNTWTGADNFTFETSTDGTGTAGTQYDLLAITGSLNLTGATGVNLKLISMADSTNAGLLGSWDPSVNHTWAGFVTTTTGITGTPTFSIDTSSFQNSFTGTFGVVQNGNNLDLVYTAAVPEPASLSLLAIGGIALLARRRKA